MLHGIMMYAIRYHQHTFLCFEVASVLCIFGSVEREIYAIMIVCMCLCEPSLLIVYIEKNHSDSSYTWYVNVPY